MLMKRFRLWLVIRTFRDVASASETRKKEGRRLERRIARKVSTRNRMGNCPGKPIKLIFQNLSAWICNNWN